MQKGMRNRGIIGGLLSFGLLVGLGVAPGLTQAQTISAGPYYATPSWDQTLPSATRFIVLSNFSNAAVLDRETGLVWERTPQVTSRTWNSARFECARSTVGGRRGWRLPSLFELMSLIDPSVLFPGPLLPTGHPFTVAENVIGSTGVTRGFYWVATSDADLPTSAWNLGMGSGVESTSPKTGLFGSAWCVRGAMNAEAY